MCVCVCVCVRVCVCVCVCMYALTERARETVVRQYRTSICRLATRRGGAARGGRKRCVCVHLEHTCPGQRVAEVAEGK